MKNLLTIIVVMIMLVGCGGNGGNGQQAESSQSTVNIKYDVPDPIPVPERNTPASEDDWEARVHNKNIEIIEVVNILNPVAAYITAGFKQYGRNFSPTLHEEWEDTQAQLTKALEIWEDGKKRMAEKKFSKTLFLDLENSWQMLVKTGVAGIRTKSMVDSEVLRLTR